MSAIADLQQKLAVSESKRAELIAEVTRLNEQLLSRATGGPITGSPRRQLQLRPGDDTIRTQTADAVTVIAALQDELRESEKKRVQLVKDMEEQRLFFEEQRNSALGIASGPIGITTFASMPQPLDDDFGFDEEDDARQKAEEVMSKLLRALHTQRESQEQLAQAQLEISDLKNQLEQSQGRELLLGNMVRVYHESRQSPSSLTTTTATAKGGSVASASFSNADALLQEAINNVTRADGVRRRLTETKLDETLRENVALRSQLQQQGGAAPPTTVNSSSSRELSPTNGRRSQLSIAGFDPAEVPLLSEERAALLEYAKREQMYTERFEKLRQIVLEKDRAVKDLQILLKVHTANASNAAKGSYAAQ